MSKNSSILLIVTLLFFVFQKDGLAANSEAVFVVAKVNNKIVTNLELIDRYRFVLFSSKIKINSDLERQNLLDQIINKMIDEELIRQEATNLKIDIPVNEVEQAADSMAFHQKKNLAQFKISLIEHGISYIQYLRQIEAELIWSKVVSETLRSRIHITDAEISEFFEQRKLNTNFSKFLIAEVLIDEGKNSEAFAKKLVSELRAGADFRGIVKQFSRDSLTVENNGELGWVSQRDIDPKIYNVISKLKKNEYSNPVLSGDGYYIFKVLNIKQESRVEEKDLDAARNNIFLRKLQAVAKGHLADLRKRAFVEINHDKINKIHF